MKPVGRPGGPIVARICAIGASFTLDRNHSQAALEWGLVFQICPPFEPGPDCVNIDS